jgi:geranylgeranyl pyrophosphate synthase
VSGEAAPTEPATALDAWLGETASWVEELLRRWLRESDDGAAGPLHEAMAYAALGGGKRLRPALVRLCCAALGGSDEACAPAAAAVELVHAYSLVHDDLPCMDDDDLRRGRPTCHRVFGEAMAVLAGDALQAKAFEALASADPARAQAWTRVLARAAGAAGMVGGQALDMTLPGTAPDAESVRAMHARKTGALFCAAAEMGAIAAAADPPRREAARRFGAALGRLFQAVDDVLDVTGDARTLGKTPGKDAAHEKASLVAARGLEGARAEVADLVEAARGAALDLGLAPGHLALEWVGRLGRRRS